ncbi:MAG TPA: tetratricopeptide repeat protein, partial [Nocardioidaceae bacterium]|nr:tetratricopeptide repeat protein [Nocardioidaceae bacterium]
RGLVSRENARRIAVEPMPSNDAVALLAERFGISTADSPEDLAELAELCGRLPVALSVAAERAGRDGTPRIAAVNERLRDERNRFEALTDWADDPLTDVRAVFSWSYHALGDDTARIFRLLGLHPHVRIATGAAAALAGLDERATERLLDKLTDRHLIAEIDLGWYELHDLSHAYAAELAADDSAESEAAVSRLRSWYLQSVRNARYVYPVPRVTIPLPEPLPGTSPARFGSREQAADWFVDHFPALRSVLTAAAADGDDMTVALITPLLYRFLKFIGASREAIDLYTVAQECARRTGDREVLAVCTYFYAQCLDQVGDVDASLAAFQRARELFADIDHPSGRLGVEITLGTVYAKLNRFDESIRTQEEALRDTDGAPGSVVALILNNLASTYLAHGRIAEAIETAQSAIDLDSGSDDFDADVAATAYVTLGESYSADERWAEAVRSLTDGAELFHRHGNVAREILVLQLRGTAHRELGHIDAARTDWTTALELLDQIGRERVPAHLTAVPGTRDELLRLLDSLDAA